VGAIVAFAVMVAWLSLVDGAKSLAATNSDLAMAASEVTAELNALRKRWTATALLRVHLDWPRNWFPR
ncbi:MAG: hypothetical protein ACRD3S_16385, partial [Terracidiphilus sp.]